jgi:hypothetical protein
MRWLRFISGLALLPLGMAAAQTLWDMLVGLQAGSRALVAPAPAALSAGFLAWLLFYAVLPLPVRAYVWAHELTHALWAWLFGIRVLSIRVRKDRGAVTLSDSNCLVTLAPYFFPLYTLLTIAAYYSLSVFIRVEAGENWWLAAVGFTWGFHFTFTLTALLQRQSDIRDCGRLFSYALIGLLNLLGVCAWVVLVTRATLGLATALMEQHVRGQFAAAGAAVRWLTRALQAALQ